MTVHYTDASDPDAPPADWTPIVEGLRQAIPAGLVEDVVVNNRSWRDR